MVKNPGTLFFQESLMLFLDYFWDVISIYYECGIFIVVVIYILRNFLC